MKKINFKYLILFALLNYKTAWSEEKRPLISSKVLSEYQKKIDKLNSDFLILRKNGPEAYYKARNIRLTKAEKQLMSKDLMKIVNMKMEPPYVFMLPNENKIIIKDDFGSNSFVLSEMMSGTVNDGHSKTSKITDNTDYSIIRNLFSN
ncbi:MAG: hypothetical protein KA116_06240 [Proteobacteria bacterium]|nr:hypothetical protein [Pseudomonadota bacterium]